MRTHLHRDGGFSLVELLVVVLILGILAAIAIPSLMAYRERAYANTVTSDLRNAMIFAWSSATASPEAQMPQTWQELLDAGHRPSAGASPEDGAVVVWDPGAPCLSIAHASNTDRPLRIQTDPTVIEEAACSGSPVPAS